jgi:flavorubredoxin
MREITPNVYYVGAIDWDRRLFDELIPLPDGTSYNSYLIRGSSATALIDTVDPTKEQVLIDNLRKLNVNRIDYVISNHAEQDHSGTIPKILELYPEAKVVTNPKCRDLLKSMLLIPDSRFTVVNDRETISLGDKTLEFIIAPWVHWPDTMFTYLREERILFTCDFLGSHLATSSLYVADQAEVYVAAKRYYAEIMMPFRAAVNRNLEKIKDLEIKIAAPSHGPIYNRPEFIINAYKDWASDEVKNEVVLPFVSMHGSTRRMVEYFVDAMMKKGVTVKPFNLTRTDIGDLAMALVDAATVVVATPAALVGPHPAAVYAVYLANALRPKCKYASVIGSYGWGAQIVETIKAMLTNLKVELIEPVIVNGFPKEQDFKSLDRLAEDIAKRHREANILR